MEDDDNPTLFQTEEEKADLQKRILGDDVADDSDFDTVQSDTNAGLE